MVGTTEVSNGSVSPLTATPGAPRRRLGGPELLARYQQHYGITFPPAIVASYFQPTFTEYEDRASGLRWFDPPVAGGADFYEYLGRTLPWYYSADTWDKRHALTLLRRLGAHSVFEAGCGGGELLIAARACGLEASGSELNAAQVDVLCRAGLKVFPANALPDTCRAEALVLLQVLEHVKRPLEFVRRLIDCVRPKHVLIAVPAHDTLLGRTRDPLVWPPHHISLWSGRALESLASLLGGRLIEVAYEPLPWPRFHQMMAAGLDEPIAGLPPPERPRLLSIAYRLARAGRRPWARRAHTVFGVITLNA